MPSARFETALGCCGISWDGGKITGFRLPPVVEMDQEPPAWVSEVIERVRLHLSGAVQDFADLPYAWERVSPFQQEVYQAALRVKPGETWSYGRLAAAIGQGNAAARAVGMALGQNPWPLFVPCHRFIGADGKMTGFSAPGGIKTKLRLLALEGAQLFAE